MVQLVTVFVVHLPLKNASSQKAEIFVWFYLGALFWFVAALSLAIKTLAHSWAHSKDYQSS